MSAQRSINSFFSAVPAKMLQQDGRASVQDNAAAGASERQSSSAAAGPGPLSQRDSRSAAGALHGPKRQKTQGEKPTSKAVQMHLDAGQRDFAMSRCKACGMVYTPGLPEDEKLHRQFHDDAEQGFKYNLTGKERVLLETADRCKLVLIPSTDAAPQLKKVQQLASQVESATGVAPGWLLSCGSFKVVLACDASRRVRGLLVAEVISRAYPVALPTPAEAAKPEASAAAVAAASSDGPHAPRGSLQAAGSTPPPVHEPPAPPASQQHLRVAAAAADQPPELQALPQKPVKAACGVRMVWVAPMHRRRRLASQLLDAARYHLIPGYVVPRHQVAFSYPTEEGRRLASAYGSSSNGIGGSSSSGSGVGSSCYLVYSPLVTTNGINGR